MMLTSWWSRRFMGHILKGCNQVLRQIVILMSIEMNSFMCWGRKSQRIISRNNNWRTWRRRRNRRNITMTSTSWLGGEGGSGGTI